MKSLTFVFALYQEMETAEVGEGVAGGVVGRGIQKRHPLLKKIQGYPKSRNFGVIFPGLPHWPPPPTSCMVVILAQTLLHPTSYLTGIPLAGITFDSSHPNSSYSSLRILQGPAQSSLHHSQTCQSFLLHPPSYLCDPLP